MAADAKVWIVTGASRGIGAAIAKDLGAQGCNVVVNYAASEGPALEVVEAIKASGGDAIAIKANMAELDDIKAMFKQVAAEFGGCDVLVNNAGVLGARRLAQALQFNPTLKHLAIANNDLGDEGFKVLREQLMARGIITNLDFSNNGISCQMLRAGKCCCIVASR